MKNNPLDQKVFSYNDFQELYLKKASIKPFQNLVDLKNEAIRRAEEPSPVEELHTLAQAFSDLHSLILLPTNDSSLLHTYEFAQKYPKYQKMSLEEMQWKMIELIQKL